jgi:hypothetical protein
MLAAIDLDHQSSFVASEVDYERADRRLASEAPVIQAMSS